VNVKALLKATVKKPSLDQYNDLRADTVSTPRIIVVLFLPSDEKDWLVHSEDALMLKNCAYWVSLREAEASNNAAAQTVYLPKHQTFDPVSLINILAKISKHEIPVYQEVAS
jgi:hypothetical protein